MKKIWQKEPADDSQSTVQLSILASILNRVDCCFSDSWISI
ncbi:hypothetical protein LLB_3105 [Legionella longbeachae D-4968]|nr:hypothetical protein LLB_3105 [Legionella longbeachae D-4968]